MKIILCLEESHFVYDDDDDETLNVIKRVSNYQGT